MTQPAIKVEGLWKEYVIGAQQKAHSTFYDMLSSSLSAPFRALRKRTTEEHEAESFWALRDVNFEVQPGKVVGIIGRNGAGKSTLLKILSRITAPTRGHVEVRGRLASLLEVGTGFHPELSGRENIFLNGAILGMTRRDITQKFDEIVAFAEVEQFIDTPVKRYSSGMYVRLAFSVAAHLETDVLVVDEVLAVGDQAFQKKCLGKMREVGRTGRTVVFVSHNLAAVASLCSDAILLAEGAVTMKGFTGEILSQYLNFAAVEQSERSWARNDAPGTASFALRRVTLQSSHPVVSPTAERSLRVILEIESDSHTRQVDLGVMLTNAQGVCVVHTAGSVGISDLSFACGLNTVTFELPIGLLRSGHYSVSISASVPNVKFLFQLDDVVACHVENDPLLASPYSDSAWQGVMHPKIGRWRTSAMQTHET